MNRPNIRLLVNIGTLTEVWNLIKEFDPELKDHLQHMVDDGELSHVDAALIGLSLIEGDGKAKIVTFDTKIAEFEYEGLRVHNCWGEEPEPTEPPFSWEDYMNYSRLQGAS